MYEDREGEFVYTIQKHRFSTGKASWIWHVRHAPCGCTVDAGSLPGDYPALDSAP
jgi:hypothetical protein